MTAAGSSVVPAGWQLCARRTHEAGTGAQDQKHSHYYFNQYTGECRWSDPSAEAETSLAVAETALSRKTAREASRPPAPTSLRMPAGVGPRVAIIVPFRDLHEIQQRTAHRRKFVPHMLRFLSSPACCLRDFTVVLVDQSNDGRKFNRGKLLNIGFALTEATHDVFVFHDVDLLPGEDLAGAYRASPPPRTSLHVARCWDRYSNSNEAYFGGIVTFTRDDFKAVNGFPNNYWGWGGEDDELYKRTVAAGVQIVAPHSGTITDLEDMDLKGKVALLRKHPEWKNRVRRGARGWCC